MIQSEVKVFITGATGFIGKHLLMDPVIGSCKIFALTRRKEPENRINNSNVTYVTGDLLRVDDYKNILKDCDFVVHIAGEKRTQSLMHETNVVGIEILLKEIVKLKDLKLIYISSGGVYGIENHPDQILTEDSVCYPGNTYERSKIEAEKIIKHYGLKYPLEYVILRPTNVFGEFDDGRKLLNLCRSLKQKKFILLDKNANINYVYVGYLTAVISEIISKKVFNNQIYNINSHCTISAFIEDIMRELNLAWRIPVIPVFVKPVFYLIAKVCDNLPIGFQFFNSEKYRELTNRKIYSSEKIKQLLPIDDKQFLFLGLKNLISHYQKEGLV